MLCKHNVSHYLHMVTGLPFKLLLSVCTLCSCLPHCAQQAELPVIISVPLMNLLVVPCCRCCNAVLSYCAGGQLDAGRSC